MRVVLLLFAALAALTCAEDPPEELVDPQLIVDTTPDDLGAELTSGQELEELDAQLDATRKPTTPRYSDCRKREVIKAACPLNYDWRCQYADLDEYQGLACCLGENYTPCREAPNIGPDDFVTCGDDVDPTGHACDPRAPLTQCCVAIFASENDARCCDPSNPYCCNNIDSDQ